ncbi:MAG TPA: DUF3224 domain-containing protein [Streptosporangiaceae bacterium]|nr:DUF3224 domain-containing protein [Streptosporangiaceae bacterium]
MAHAKGTFTVATWDENTYQEMEAAAKLTKATVTYGLAGDIVGEATWDAVMYYRPDGTAVFTGLQRVHGRVAGVDGSFVMQADGEFEAGEARSRWEVIEGSGTGGLARIKGTGTAVATATPPGSYSIDYDLG